MEDYNNPRDYSQSKRFNKNDFPEPDGLIHK